MVLLLGVKDEVGDQLTLLVGVGVDEGGHAVGAVLGDGTPTAVILSVGQVLGAVGA